MALHKGRLPQHQLQQHKTTYQSDKGSWLYHSPSDVALSLEYELKGKNKKQHFRLIAVCVLALEAIAFRHYVSTREAALVKKFDTLDLFPTLGAKKKSSTKRPNSAVSEHISDDLAIELWGKCLTIIRDNVNQQVFRTWFEPTCALRWVDDVITIQVQSQFFCEWIEEHYYALLRKAVLQIFGSKARLQYQVVVNKNGSSPEERTIKLPAFRGVPSQQSQQSVLPFINAPAATQNFPTHLNPRYTFENFIRGDSNQLAASAAIAVAENPGKTRFNPLCLYGGAGLGKTHLMQAIGNQIMQNHRNLRVYYTNSERFTIEYVNAIQNNKVSEFANFYRSVDVLIVDDIQFFSGKEKTQDNFFHTFNALYQVGKQIILSSDKPPKDLSGVDERLLSRFQWGLTADIQPPDYEMRLAILQRKSADEGFELPSEVAEYLARHVSSSVRELEGALISLLAKVSLDNRMMSVGLAQEVVSGSKQSPLRRITADEIKKEVAAYYKVPMENLIGKTRKHEIVLARQVAAYLMKQLTDLSLKAIGSQLGGRDHTTIIHSCETVENYLLTDSGVTLAVETLRKRF